MDIDIIATRELIHSDLKEAILMSARQRREADARFAALCESIQGESYDAALALVDEYIRAEPIGLFKEQARCLLDDEEG